MAHASWIILFLSSTHISLPLGLCFSHGGILWGRWHQGVHVISRCHLNSIVKVWKSSGPFFSLLGSTLPSSGMPLALLSVQSNPTHSADVIHTPPFLASRGPQLPVLVATSTYSPSMFLPLYTQGLFLQPPWTFCGGRDCFSYPLWDCHPLYLFSGLPQWSTHGKMLTL